MLGRQLHSPLPKKERKILFNTFLKNKKAKIKRKRNYCNSLAREVFKVNSTNSKLTSLSDN